MSIEQVAINAAQFYRGRGLSKDAAVAIVSGQGHQSTETPGALNPSGAYGISSWNGPRQERLANYATVYKLPVGELTTQLGFTLTEMANSYPKSWAAINSAETYASIIPVIVAEYENPADHQKEIIAAMEFAPGLMAALPVAAAPVPLPLPSTAPQSAPAPQAQPAPAQAPVPAPRPVSHPLPLPTFPFPLPGLPAMPPIDPALVTQLLTILAPVVESIMSGLIKGLISQLTATASPTATSATPLATAAGIPSELLTSLGPLVQQMVAAELAKIK
jgi:hypothetical protein